MSEIFNPAIGAITPKVIDGVANLVSRRAGSSNNTAVATTIGSVELPPFIFSNDRNNAIVEVRFIGRIVGADATTMNVLFDAANVGNSTSAAISTPGSFICIVYITYLNGQVAVQFKLKRGPTGTNATLDNLRSLGALIPYDNTISHTISFQSLSAAGTTTVTCDNIHGFYL